MIEAETSVKNRFVIPYKQRDHFRRFHASPKRFRFVVAHRRAGKSVAEINELIKKAFENPREYPPPRYAYIGPTFAQTKDLIWGYVHHYLSPLGDAVKFSESDLQVTLPNGALINLYGGASAYERMRGLYFDGAVADEFAMLDPDMWPLVVRPCLADYKGFFIASGTSNGDDHFHALKVKAELDPSSWDVFVIPVTETDALDPDELKDMTKDMTPEQYAREMLCSFDAPIEGAFYADLMNSAQEENRITSVPWQPDIQCWTEWDLDIQAPVHVNIKQMVGRAVHQIDEISLDIDQVGLAGVVRELTTGKRKNYLYKAHLLPHDIKAREQTTGVTRLSVLQGLLDAPVHPVDLHSVEDGITATRSLIPITYYSKENAPKTIMALRNYQRAKSGKPLHNWASHPADATRIGAMGMALISGWGANVIPLKGRLRRHIRGRA
jgi:phage terminase large subunit